MSNIYGKDSTVRACTEFFLSIQRKYKRASVRISLDGELVSSPLIHQAKSIHLEVTFRQNKRLMFPQTYSNLEETVHECFCLVFCFSERLCLNQCSSTCQPPKTWVSPLRLSYSTQSTALMKGWNSAARCDHYLLRSGLHGISI